MNLKMLNFIMAEPASHIPKLVEVDPTPLWYRITGTLIFAAIIGLIVTLGFIIRDYLRVDPLASVYRQCRKPLIQYRLEKNSWPADFDFAKPSADLAAYGFNEAVKKSMGDCDIPGKWSFTLNKGPMGPGKPTIIFQPTESDIFSRRVLLILDERLDDGVPETGDFRVTDELGAFRLKDQ
jgi:hypothetical protein